MRLRGLTPTLIGTLVVFVASTRRGPGEAPAGPLRAWGTVSLSGVDGGGLPAFERTPVSAMIARRETFVAVTLGTATCRLQGRAELVGLDDCDFTVGVEAARRHVHCQAPDIGGWMDGDRLKLHAHACTALLGERRLIADLDVVLQLDGDGLLPAPPGRQPSCDGHRCTWYGAVDARRRDGVDGPLVPAGVTATVTASGTWSVARESGPEGNGIRADRSSFVRPGLGEGQLIVVELRGDETNTARGYTSPGLRVRGPAVLRFEVNDELAPESTKFQGFDDNQGAVDVVVVYER